MSSASTSAGPPWPVELSVGKDAKTNGCIFPAPGALQGIELPQLVVVEGPNGNRGLVGVQRAAGPPTRTVTWVTDALMKKIAPGTEAGKTVKAKVKPASKADVVILMSREADRKVITAAVIFVLALFVAGAGFATAKVSLLVAVIILVLGCIAAGLTFLNAFKEALTPKCS